ncbi:5'-nucleotidase domain-containing protein 2 [Sinocyclocheilus grahami]|uniref:5'-nucleotidase domain-containing protein 2 n=1 Tax=Sinocyclocheilus grahami TaxID=75366 RepID=UPI0007AD60EC|nr:PREDICTED: 5'-nucleotidase domain-containing protein 2-like [Sinocyclocheilus grahami]
MACKKIGSLSNAMWQRSTTCRVSLCAGLNIPAFACGSFASAGATMNGQNCCKDGHNCGPTRNLAANHNPVAAAVTSHRHQIVGKNRGEESLNKSGRAFSSTAPQINNKTYLWARYNEMKRLVHDLIPPGVCNLLNPSTIYANNEVNLEEVDIYGFDYDYTLALYSSALDEMIYNKAREFLVQHYKVRERHNGRILSFQDAIGMVHIKGYMYKWIMQDLEKYILRGDETYAVLHRLASHGKKLFLITNSPFSFVDKGMKYMVGKEWRDFFDVVIVQADKPHFFNDCLKPFRRLDSNGDLQWDRIKSLDKGQIYKQGNLVDFLKLTGWRGSKVFYFGDHLYSDLADLMLRHGWRTGAIVPELEVETKVVNTEQYAQSLTWLQALTGLLERMQMYREPESKEVLQEWLKEREELRAVTKNLFNPHFGSIFRTCHNPTYFSRRLCRFSDLYMASISCLLNYDLSYTFYPRRTPLQHEAPLWMDQLCTGCMKTPFLEEMAHIR